MDLVIQIAQSELSILAPFQNEIRRVWMSWRKFWESSSTPFNGAGYAGHAECTPRARAPVGSKFSFRYKGPNNKRLPLLGRPGRS